MLAGRFHNADGSPFRPPTETSSTAEVVKRHHWEMSGGREEQRAIELRIDVIHLRGNGSLMYINALHGEGWGRGGGRQLLHGDHRDCLKAKRWRHNTR